MAYKAIDLNNKEYTEEELREIIEKPVRKKVIEEVEKLFQELTITDDEYEYCYIIKIDDWKEFKIKEEK